MWEGSPPWLGMWPPPIKPASEMVVGVGTEGTGQMAGDSLEALHTEYSWMFPRPLQPKGEE
jgi:hypothetical protein